MDGERSEHVGNDMTQPYAVKMPGTPRPEPSSCSQPEGQDLGSGPKFDWSYEML